MNKMKFIKKTVNPADLYLHKELIELGFDHRPDAIFCKMLEEYGLYERAVIDNEGGIITHGAEVLAAVQNGVTQMEVYETDLTPIQLKLFILLKNAYSRKNLRASYKTAAFFREALKEGEISSDLVDHIDGDANKKIAALMHTSDSTIKRLLRVGDNVPEKLGLIQENETSFKEVLDQLKLQQLTERSLAKRAVATAVAEEEEKEETEPANSSIIATSSEMEVEEDDEVDQADDQNSGQESSQENETASVQSNTGVVNFSSADMTIAGIGNLKIDTTSPDASIVFNGKPMTNVEYLVFHNDSGGNAKSESFVLREKKKHGMSIQITISNYSNAA